MKFNRFLIVIFMMAVLLVGLNVGKAVATEGGGGHYTGGTDDFMVGSVNPAGFYFTNYLEFYNLTDYPDKRIGLSATNVGKGAGVPMRDSTKYGRPDQKGYNFFEQIKFTYVGKTKILGANPYFKAAEGVQYSHSEYTAPLYAKEPSDTKTGLQDMSIGAGLGWHLNKNLHMIAEMNLYLPAGAYDGSNSSGNTGDSANIGANYYTYMPAWSITYLSDGGYEASAKFMYNINTTNTQTGYSSGDEFHLDYLLGKHCGKWNYGINGYYYYQTTKDDFRGQDPTFDGNKGRVFAFGPAVSYKFQNMTFKLKYAYETAVTNRPEGQRYWFDFAYAF